LREKYHKLQIVNLYVKIIRIEDSAEAAGKVAKTVKNVDKKIAVVLLA
jgi:hypothetical protein